MLNEIGIRELINGPIPISADGEPIIGLSPQLDNFYLCCGFTSGIAASGGAGWVMANWIVDGDPGMDLWPFDVRRFGAPHSVKRFMYERAVESYGRYYHVAWPNAEPDVGRNGAAQPLACAARGRERGVRQQVRMGAAELVRAARCGTGGAAVVRARRRVRRDRARARGRARARRHRRHDARSRSSRSQGPGALALLQQLAVNDLDRPAGSIVYTQLCNARGGIEADVTITRLADDRFYFVTGSALGVRDRSTIERALPADGSVTLVDHTSARSGADTGADRARATCSQR